METATGIVVSAIAGYYFVDRDSTVFLCRGRGRLRKASLSPLVGDHVRFTASCQTETGSIEEIRPRRNQLQRPAVANVDAVVVVIAAHSPEPNFLLLDKLLALVRYLDLEAVVCVNKVDLDPGLADRYADVYRGIGFPAVTCSAATGQGMAELGQVIGRRVVVLAGQSGVGKSRITAGIASGQLKIPVQVGELSAKLARGKHTTRHVSLLPLAGGGKVADTPGFSIVDLEVESNDLHSLYPEFLNLADACRFSPCTHIHEPGCAVKAELDAGNINPGRYANYLKIYEELRAKEANRY